MKKFLIIFFFWFSSIHLTAQWNLLERFYYPSGNEADVYEFFIDENLGMFAGIRSLGLYHSSDNGSSWQYKGFKHHEGDISKIIIDNLNRLLIINGEIFFSVDTGNSWQKSKVVNFGGGGSEIVKQLVINNNNGYWYAGAENRSFYISPDNGATWSYVRTFTPSPCGSTFYGDFTSLMCFDTESVLAGSFGYDADWGGTFCYGSKLYKSFNGIIWYEVLDEQIENIVDLGGGIIIAAEEREIFKSNDSGDTWTNVYTFGTDINVIKVGSESEIIIGSDNGVYRTDDLCVTWEHLGLNGAHVYDIQFDADGRIFTATNTGVYYAGNPITEVKNDKKLKPADFVLNQNYPNPFNPETKISFTLPFNSRVKIRIYDILGKEVANLMDGYLSEGIHEINWRPENLNSGIYFCHLTADGISETASYSKVLKMSYIK